MLETSAVEQCWLRVRKDAILCRRAPVGSRRFYEREKFTPDQVRRNEALARKKTTLFYGGRWHKVRCPEATPRKGAY
jgi:hypothetical protein